MRCAAFSGAMGRILLGKEQNSAEGHFYDKLLNVKDRMKVRVCLKILLTTDACWKAGGSKATSGGELRIFPMMILTDRIRC